MKFEIKSCLNYLNSLIKSFRKSVFFKKRKLFTILTFVLIGASIPIFIAKAFGLSDFWCIMNPAVCIETKVVAGVISSGGVTNYIKDVITDQVVNGNPLYLILYNILVILLELAFFLVKFGAWLVDSALDPVIYTGTSTTPGVLTSVAINTGWETVRDICNTLFVFFLLIIAFGTIFRSSAYNIKNLLPKIIISLFLINFSALIAKLIIDFGQIFMYEIRGWMGTFQEGSGTLTSIIDKFKNEINFELTFSLASVVRASFALAYTVMLGLVYIMLALFLLVRLVAFAILIIVSPFAFLSYAMPFLSSYTTRWWNAIIKYSLFGPTFLFFVYLATIMANELVVPMSKAIPSASAIDELRPISYVILLIVPHLISLLMLAATVPLANEFSIAMTDKIVGGRLGLGKVGMGTYLAAKAPYVFGKKAAKKTESIARRSERAGKWIDRRKKNYAGLMSKIGLHGEAIKIEMEIEREKDERYKKFLRENFHTENPNYFAVDLQRAEAMAKQYASDPRWTAFFLKAAAAQKKLGNDKTPLGENYDNYINGKGTIALTGKEVAELHNLRVASSAESDYAKGRVEDAVEKGNFDTFNTEAQNRLKEICKAIRDSTLEQKKQNEAITAAVKKEIIKEKLAYLSQEGKLSGIQDLNNPNVAEAVIETFDPKDMEKLYYSLTKDQRKMLAKGFGKIFDDKDKIKRIIKKDPTKIRTMMATKTRIDGKFAENIKVSGLVKLDDKGKIAHDGNNFKIISEMTKQLQPEGFLKLDDKSLSYVAETITKSQITSLQRAGYHVIVGKIKDILEKKMKGIDGEEPFFLDKEGKEIKDKDGRVIKKIDGIKEKIEAIRNKIES